MEDQEMKDYIDQRAEITKKEDEDRQIELDM